MKKAKRLGAILLALVLLTSSFTACSSKKKNLGTTMLRLEDTELSENIFALYLSRLKGSMASSYLYGEEATKDSFWDKYMDSDGLTYNEYYTDQVLHSAKMSTAVLHLFEEKELTLPQSRLDAIDRDLQDLLEQDADGSMTKFNELLSDYGANYDVLREARVIEEKFSYLTDYLLGSDGSKLGGQLIEDYYKSHYVRFKQIFIYTSDYAYETDENGDDVYFDKTGKIAYDTSAIEQEQTDRFGSKIYLTEDGRVAYDKVYGTRKQLKNSEDKPYVKPFTGERLDQALALADEVYGKTKQGDTVGFEELIVKYNENRGTEKYVNGIYITEDVTTDLVPAALTEALFGAADGDVLRVRTEEGVHIVMRYALDDGAYADSENSDFFISTSTGTYTFIPDLKSAWMRDYLEPYVERVELVSEDSLKRYDMKSVMANLNY